MGVVIGETLGTYRILSTIGKGGMGVVYLAEHTLIGRQAAVKLLRPELSSDAELVDRFFTEARAAAAARHQGLVEVFDFGVTDDGNAYIVMELLQGESLTMRLERQPRFASELALSITRQVASALQAAHETGVVHRDLKPENIHLIADASAPAGVRIKVLDFGIAKLAGDEDRRSVRTRTGVVIGTPRYMSPEQCKSASNVDARTDIYALGCIFYEMLTGKPPFDYDNWGELVAAHIHETAPPPSARVPDLMPEIEDIVMRAIAREPADRYQSMTELSEAIDTLWPAANSLTFTPIPGSLRTIRQSARLESATPTLITRRRRPWVPLLAGAIVLGGVTAVVVAKRTPEPEPAPKPAVVAARPIVVAPDAAEVTIAIDAAVAPSKITIVVKSDPSGAEVLRADGISLGKTPVTRELDRVDGELPLLVKLAGFKDVPIKLSTLHDGEQLVKLERRPLSSVRRGSGTTTTSKGSGATVIDPYK